MRRTSLLTSPSFSPKNRSTKNYTEHSEGSLIYPFEADRTYAQRRRALTHGSEIESRELCRLNQPGAPHLALSKVLNKSKLAVAF